jgi:hypothetical protein
MNVTVRQHLAGRIDSHSAPVLVRILTSSIVYSSALYEFHWRAIADLAKGVKALEVAHEAIATHLVCFADCVKETRKQECNVHSRSRRDVHLAESNRTPFIPSLLHRCSVAPMQGSQSKSGYASGEANEGST